MAASPALKVYMGAEYRASCKYPEDAAALVAFLGAGSTIRLGHTLKAWREGHEDQSASESYDYVAETIARRRMARNEVRPAATGELSPAKRSSGARAGQYDEDS